MKSCIPSRDQSRLPTPPVPINFLVHVHWTAPDDSPNSIMFGLSTMNKRSLNDVRRRAVIDRKRALRLARSRHRHHRRLRTMIRIKTISTRSIVNMIFTAIASNVPSISERRSAMSMNADWVRIRSIQLWWRRTSELSTSRKRNPPGDESEKIVLLVSFVQLLAFLSVEDLLRSSKIN